MSIIIIYIYKSNININSIYIHCVNNNIYKRNININSIYIHCVIIDSLTKGSEGPQHELFLCVVEQDVKYASPHRVRHFVTCGREERGSIQMSKDFLHGEIIIKLIDLLSQIVSDISIPCSKQLHPPLTI